MVKYQVFVFLFIMAVTAFAAPAEEKDLFEALPLPGTYQEFKAEDLPTDLEPGMYREFEAVIRMTRFTCDVLSGWGVNHTACALNCIRLGYKGGRCINGVCNCRN